jgi:hypothetical protein
VKEKFEKGSVIAEIQKFEKGSVIAETPLCERKVCEEAP